MPKGPDGTSNLGAAPARGRLKSSSSEGSAARASRIVSGGSFQFASIIRSTEVCSNCRCETGSFAAHGATSMAGTRTPMLPSVSPAASEAGGMGARGGGTWSKKPPHSSKLMNSTVSCHSGERTTAS